MGCLVALALLATPLVGTLQLLQLVLPVFGRLARGLRLWGVFGLDDHLPLLARLFHWRCRPRCRRWGPG